MSLFIYLFIYKNTHTCMQNLLGFFKMFIYEIKYQLNDYL